MSSVNMILNDRIQSIDCRIFKGYWFLIARITIALFTPEKLSLFLELGSFQIITTKSILFYHCNAIVNEHFEIKLDTSGQEPSEEKTITEDLS